jgi:large subunit ribosomal protein L21
MKYAVIKASGKQFKVQEGDLIKLDKLKGKPKDKLTFDEVLLVVDKEKATIGQPLIKGHKVSGEIVEQKKDKKIRVARFKAKSKYRKVKGHRSEITLVKITKI